MERGKRGREKRGEKGRGKRGKGRGKGRGRVGTLWRYTTAHKVS